MTQILAIAKMFAQKEYADDFRRGKLHANTLNYFQRLEEGGGRSDPFEGAVWLPLDNSILTIGSYTFPNDQLARPVSFQSNLTGRINVVCLYAFHSGEFPDPDDLPSDMKVYKHEFSVPKDCQNDFGPYAVLITDLGEFMARLDKELQESYIKGRILSYRRGSVNYSDYQPSLWDYMGRPEPTIGSLEPAFHKLLKFHGQNEYRIAFDTGKDQKLPCSLNIGDISDITLSLRTSELRGRYECPIDRS